MKTLTDAKCVEIKDNAVVIENKRQLQDYPCNSVVVAIGAKSRSFENKMRFAESITFHVMLSEMRSKLAER
ncbi:hypothetical protein [Paenibacillus polymyxa]|uniref:hypothetical protein n=1 Tax=Paenibacillus polymyxa TaxID=1406 RepID=UPI00234BB8FE|nr:hypothetical protein [Paenibacillus polymyxa]WCM63759.1 hypothetical protein OYT09_12875 [Paenibacillus polymyxa]